MNLFDESKGYTEDEIDDDDDASQTSERSCQEKLAAAADDGAEDAPNAGTKDEPTSEPKALEVIAGAEPGDKTAEKAAPKPEQQETPQAPKSAEPNAEQKSESKPDDKSEKAPKSDAATQKYSRDETGADGSNLKEFRDKAGNSWSVETDASGNKKERVKLVDGRAVERQHNRDGLALVIVRDEAGKPVVAYQKNPAGIWLKTEISGKDTKTVAGKVTLEADEVLPKFTAFDSTSELKQLNDTPESKAARLKLIQDAIISSLAVKYTLEATELERTTKGKAQVEIFKLGLPADESKWSEEQKKQAAEVRTKVAEPLEKLRAECKAKIEKIEAERRAGVFGPESQAEYAQLVQWLETKRVPQLLKGQSNARPEVPPGCPFPLPVDAVPGATGAPLKYATPESVRIQWKSESAVSLGINNMPTEVPSFADSQKLGQVLSWIKDSEDKIAKKTRDSEVNIAIPNLIKDRGLPAGWNYQPGRDPDAYRLAFFQAQQTALRTRNLIGAAVDSDKLNLVRSKDWFRRDIAVIRAELEMPDEWTMEIDPVSKKITKLDLDLPENISPNDPVYIQKMERLTKWLDTTGKRLESALADTLAKDEKGDLAKFFFWGTSEMPPGYKIKGDDGTEVEANVLQCDLTATAGADGKINVRYTIQPQNAHLLSYQNLQYLCINAGKPLVEERTFDPEDFVVVRTGMDGIQLVKAKDLQSYITWQRCGYNAEKTLVAAMDVAMIVSGTIEARAVAATAQITTKQMVIGALKAGARIALGASGVFNNAGMRQFKIGGVEVGNFLLEARGLIFLFDVVRGLPSQLKALGGISKAVDAGSMAAKVEETYKTLSAFTRFAKKANEITMVAANFGFGPFIAHDIWHQIEKPSVEKDLQAYRDANKIINGTDKFTSDADRTEARLRSYEKLFGVPPAAKQVEAAPKEKQLEERTLVGVSAYSYDKAIATTCEALKLPESPKREKAIADAKAKMFDAFVNGTKEEKLMAAASLLALSTDKNGQVSQAQDLVTIDGKVVLKRATLDAFLADAGSFTDEERLLASELRVQLGTLTPAEYGKELKAILEQKDLPMASKSRQWARERSEYVDKLLKESLGGIEQARELAATQKTMEAYKAELMQGAGPAKAARIEKIFKETERLLSKKDNLTAEEKAELEKFKAELCKSYFRTATGKQVADMEQKRSNFSSGVSRVSDDELRAADMKTLGPAGVDREEQAAAAVCLLFLSRDKNGNVDKNANAASRDISVPAFDYTELVVGPTPWGVPVVKYADKTAPGYTLTQAVKVSDLLDVLQASVRNPNAGPRRLVASDALFLAGTITEQTYSCVLMDALKASKGSLPGSEADREWSLQRLGLLANLQRAKEIGWSKTLDPVAEKEAAAKCYGCSSEDMKKVLQATAKNPAESEDNRARAAFILRAMEESPDACQAMLAEKEKKCKLEGKSYKSLVLDELQADLKSDNFEKRFKAAIALDSFGQISRVDFNAAMMECVDSAIPELRAKAVNAIKVDRPEDLTKEQRDKLVSVVLNQPLNEMNSPVQMAILQRIERFTATHDIPQVAATVSKFLDKKSGSYPTDNAAFRVAAVGALAQLNATKTSAVVVKCMKEDPYALVRIAAMRALKKMTPPDLDKIYDEQLQVESDYAARKELDALRLCVPRELDAKVFADQWRECAERAQIDWAAQGTSMTLDDVTNGINKLGMTKDPQSGFDKQLLLDFDILFQHELLPANEWVAGAIQIGAIVEWGIKFGNGNLEPFGEKEMNRKANELMKKATDEMDRIIAIAKDGADDSGLTRDQAIAIMAYVVINNGSPASSLLRTRIVARFANALLEIAQSNNPSAAFALRQVRNATRDLHVDIEVRTKFVQFIFNQGMKEDGLYKKDEAAWIIFDAMQGTLDGMATDKPDQKNREKQVAFFKQCVEHLDKLNPIGYLGPSGKSAIPLLTYMAYRHPFKEVRAVSKTLASKLQDGCFATLLQTKEETALTPQEGADRLTAILGSKPGAETRVNPDAIVQELARTCRNKPLVENDPRLEVLQTALNHNSDKVKLAAALFLLNGKNAGVSQEAKMAALTAVAQVQASAMFHDKEALVKESADVARSYFKTLSGDRTAGAMYERVVASEIERLRNTSPVKTGAKAQGENGSVFHYDEKGRFKEIQFLYRPDDSYPESKQPTNIRFTYDDNKNYLKSVQLPDGNTYTRNSADSQIWKCPNQKEFCGQVSIKPDGTVTLEERTKTDGEASTVVSRRTFYTSGLSSTVNFEKGRVSKTIDTAGKVTEYNYSDEGKLISFTFDGDKTKVTDTWIGGAGVSTIKFCQTSIGPNGELITHGNDGWRRTISPDGMNTAVYAGPPEYLFDAAKKFEEAVSGAKNDADLITATLSERMFACGPIQDLADPRIPILQKLVASPNMSVSEAAEKWLKDNDNTVDVSVNVPDWYFRDKNVSAEDKLRLAKDAIADFSRGAPEGYVARSAANYLCSVCLDKSLPEELRMECINFMITKPGPEGVPFKKAALKALAQIANNGEKLCKQAKEYMMQLPEGDRDYAIGEFIMYTDSALKMEQKMPQADLDARLQVVLEHYNLSKGSLAAEARVWSMVLAMAGKTETTKTYKDAVEIIGCAKEKLSKPITAATDPRFPLIKKALESKDEKVRVIAAIALSDKRNKREVIGDSLNTAYYDVLQPKLSELVEKGEDSERFGKPADKAAAWSELIEFYGATGKDKSSDEYKYAALRYAQATGTVTEEQKKWQSDCIRKVHEQGYPYLGFTGLELPLDGSKPGNAGPEPAPRVPTPYPGTGPNGRPNYGPGGANPQGGGNPNARPDGRKGSQHPNGLPQPAGAR